MGGPWPWLPFPLPEGGGTKGPQAWWGQVTSGGSLPRASWMDKRPEGVVDRNQSLLLWGLSDTSHRCTRAALAWPISFHCYRYEQGWRSSPYAALAWHEPGLPHLPAWPKQPSLRSSSAPFPKDMA